MQGEAATGQLLQRGSVAPVQRQEAARFAGGPTSQTRPFDDEGLSAKEAEELGGASPDDASAADYNAHRPASGCDSEREQSVARTRCIRRVGPGGHAHRELRF